jgi:hypothetical protein
MNEKDYTQAVTIKTLYVTILAMKKRYNYALPKKMLKENPPKDDKKKRRQRVTRIRKKMTYKKTAKRQ